MIVLASKRRGCGYDSAEKVTIEARLYLSGNIKPSSKNKQSSKAVQTIRTS